MKIRKFWLEKIEDAWKQRSIVWVSGVRRVGKTTLCQSLPDNVLPDRDFQEWMDAYWAKDIQEMFRLERRHSFQKFTELLLSHSGGMFEATRYARPCEVSRTTIANYLAVLEATFAVHIIRPYSTRRSSEIVSAPKVYGFDTGFTCYYRGWDSLRRGDMGLLWEHYVLNELHAQLQTRDIRYWRDKHGHEIDFILVQRGRTPLAVECKWSADQFDAAGLKSFRKRYPRGDNYVVAEDVGRSYEREYYNSIRVKFVSLRNLIQALSGHANDKKGQSAVKTKTAKKKK